MQTWVSPSLRNTLVSSGNIKVLKLVLCAIFLLNFCQNFVHSSCVFDSIRQTSPTQTFVKYEGSVVKTDICPDGSGLCGRRLGREKRTPPKSLYKPLRISVQYASDLNTELPDKKHQDRLRKVVSRAVKRIAEILSVIPVKGNLRLSRSLGACHSVLGSGINKGKCSKVKRGYLQRGEICIDNFRIPEKHLEGLYIWNLTYPNPVRTLRQQGPGLANTDYVLYVQSKMLGQCLSSTSSVIAYATYCHLDQNNRPIAGYTNFCPRHLKNNSSYYEEKFVQVAIHEMFHALGFSNKLFDKFMDCSSSSTGVSCPKYSRVVASVLGFQRIVTPKVVQKSSEHFNCTTSAINNQFGVPLQVDSKTGKYTSHWDARFMSGAIMAPALGLPHLTVIDDMTLAVFEDSGWYKVKYGASDPFLWGKNAGCHFGTNAYCSQDGEYFCTGSSKRCHYLHHDKAVCSSDGYTGACKIYWAQPGGECYKAGNLPNENASQVHGESYTPRSRCFISNATVTNGANSRASLPVGRCYQTRCNETNLLEIKVGANGPWVLCPFSKTVTVPGFDGYVECPSQGILCRKPDPIISATFFTTEKPPCASKPSNKKRQGRLNCKITFRNMLFSKLSNKEKRSQFLQKVVDRVVHITRVGEHRLRRGQVVEGSVITTFVVMPPEEAANDCSSNDVYSIIYDNVKAGNFTVDFDGVMYTATDVEQVDKFDFSRGPSTSVAGMIVGIVIGCLVIMSAIVITVIVVSKVKAKRVQG